MNKLTIGSRGSKLALWQANAIRDMILEVYPDLEIQINIIKTQGDLNLDKPLQEIGGKTVFTTELETALDNHQIDLAIHSLKDLPSTLPDDLIYFGSPHREDIRDVFISNKWKTIGDVPDKGMIATGSNRRKAQLLQHRPDLQVKGLRGNIDTRLKKLEKSNWDGIITAAAAMHRLDLKNSISQYLDPENFVPAAGQGALGLEIVAEREDIKSILSEIIDEDTTSCCKAERIFIAQFESDCFSPMGCWARIIKDNSLIITGYVASLNGLHKLQSSIKGNIVMAEKLAIKLADDMIKNGALEIIAK